MADPTLGVAPLALNSEFMPTSFSSAGTFGVGPNGPSISTNLSEAGQATLLNKYFADQELKGWTNVGVESVKGLLAIGDMIGKYAMQGRMADLADKKLNNDARLGELNAANQSKALGVTKDITLAKTKLTKDLANIQGRTAVAKAKIAADATVQVAGKQAAQQLFLQRRFTGAPVQMLV